MLVVAANPDGQELVANWYMREKDETRRSYNNLPRLYNKYIGHDFDNRDSLTSNMPETAEHEPSAALHRVEPAAYV